MNFLRVVIAGAQRRHGLAWQSAEKWLLLRTAALGSCPVLLWVSRVEEARGWLDCDGGCELLCSDGLVFIFDLLSVWTGYEPERI